MPAKPRPELLALSYAADFAGGRSKVYGSPHSNILRLRITSTFATKAQRPLVLARTRAEHQSVNRVAGGFEASAARSSSDTRASMSSISSTLPARSSRQSAACTRVEAGAFSSTMTLSRIPVGAYREFFRLSHRWRGALDRHY